MADLKGSKTHDNLKEAFAGESQANRRYLYFAQKADVEGYPDVAALFRSVAEGETGHAFGHFDFLAEVGDPVTGVTVGATSDNLQSAIAGETYEYTEMYPGFSRTARRRGLRGDCGVARDAGPRREEPRGPVPSRAREHLVTLRLWRDPCAGTGPRTNRGSETSMRKLTVEDIQDLRVYERERDDFRRFIIEMKRARRVTLGPILTIVFENTDTMRWQVQEMARIERMLRDEQIATEIDTYNQLIPDPGELSGTLLLELTSEPALREWLPRLVGIEHRVSVVLPDGRGVVGAPSDDDESRLTRSDTTAAVHFVKFAFTADDIEMFASGPVHVLVDHPEYDHDVVLSGEQHRALLADLRDRV